MNYGGSTGYGRQYRNRLRRNWGIVDVADCSNAAKHLAKQGKADEKRLCIDGGSAGGYTTLACLAFRWGLLWQQDNQLGDLFPGFDRLTAHVNSTDLKEMVHETCMPSPHNTALLMSKVSIRAIRFCCNGMSLHLCLPGALSAVRCAIGMHFSLFFLLQIMMANICSCMYASLACALISVISCF